MPTIEYEDELACATALAAEAGEVALRHFRRGGPVELKGWADPVTAADRESEALIRAGLARRFPTDGVDGEEEGRRAGASGRTWVVDPLDGTANFAGGMPLFAVVLTLVLDADRAAAVLNVTYDPVRRELYHAVRGGGAYLNGQPLAVADRGDLATALVHLHFARGAVWPRSLRLARRVTAVAPHARSIGSTALAQAYVAAGRLDAHVKAVSGDWDVVGGNLLVVEAGGLATDLAGRPWRPGGGLLAAGPALHPRLVEVVGSAAGRRSPR